MKVKRTLYTREIPLTKVSNSEVFRKFAEYVSPGKVAMYKAIGIDFIPGKSKGCWIQDKYSDTKVINLRSSGGVFNLGHSPPQTRSALIEALDEGIDMGDHMLISEHRANLAEKLASILPGDIQYSVFGVSGGEAVDLAIKLARGYTSRKKIVSLVGGYHGHTGFAIGTGDSVFKAPFGDFEDYVQIPIEDLEAAEKEIDDKTAAFIMETIQATAGVIIPSRKYLREIRRICDEKGVVFIIDEVQAGLGRTGRMWAIEEWDIIPDIMVMGKGMSGGVYPLSVTSFRPHLQTFFDENPFVHISTAGGSDLACKVASKMLDVTVDLLPQVNERGRQFADGLALLKEGSAGLITEIRQRGLFIGIEFLTTELCHAFMSLCLKRGALALYANNRPSTLIVMPPLIISKEEVEFVLDVFTESLRDLSKLGKS